MTLTSKNMPSGIMLNMRILNRVGSIRVFYETWLSARQEISKDAAFIRLIIKAGCLSNTYILEVFDCNQLNMSGIFLLIYEKKGES